MNTKLPPPYFTIGKLALESGVGVETVRFYERKGLLKQPKKGTGTFRLYPTDYSTKIRFIRRAQELGFTLTEIKGLLAMNSSRNATCGEVAGKASEKIKQVEEKIRDLEKIRDGLLQLQLACGQGKEALACARISDCFEGKC